VVTVKRKGLSVASAFLRLSDLRHGMRQGRIRPRAGFGVVNLIAKERTLRVAILNRQTQLQMNIAMYAPLPLTGREQIAKLTLFAKGGISCNTGDLRIATISVELTSDNCPVVAPASRLPAAGCSLVPLVHRGPAAPVRPRLLSTLLPCARDPGACSPSHA
jgi:hypothetical protein